MFHLQIATTWNSCLAIASPELEELMTCAYACLDPPLRQRRAGAGEPGSFVTSRSSTQRRARQVRAISGSRPAGCGIAVSAVSTLRLII